MSRAHVIEAIIKRMRRDEGYLAYRTALGRRTIYDELVTADLRALALASCWLQEQHVASPPKKRSAPAQGEGGNEGGHGPEEQHSYRALGCESRQVGGIPGTGGTSVVERQRQGGSKGQREGERDRHSPTSPAHELDDAQDPRHR